MGRLQGESLLKALGALGVGTAIGGQVVVAWRRARAGLPPASRGAMIARMAAVLVLVPAVVARLSADRGVPLALLLLLGFVSGFDFLVRRTRLGRHLLAVGGNAEAARRASIRVDAIRVDVFAMCGALAASGGILATSRLLAVNQSSGGGDVLLGEVHGDRRGAPRGRDRRCGREARPAAGRPPLTPPGDLRGVGRVTPRGRRARPRGVALRRSASR
ncbi:hypothetical protein WMF31_36015 [Sorangium sp. So ce1036]|uniref:ABC transporter permease subunit n=1 Tax=Sorangium sp. So ce1036 TaxID=3133328 RepID=UPI003F0C03AC